MPQQARLDDRYTEGVYYNAASGDFCEIQRGEEAVELVNPQSGDVYHEVSYSDWHGEDFYPVPEVAIDDPVAYLENWVSQKMARSEMDVGLMFAGVNTKIVETDEYDYVI